MQDDAQSAQAPDQTNPPYTDTQGMGLPGFVPGGSSLAPSQQQPHAAPLEAADIDVIEKEWVNHLEAIVRGTSQDPYSQQKEISRAKADYLRKRYNKTIKLPEA